ncbi:MAG: hypothetical protein J6K99_07140 [Peptococcaceae bacterium]|nr:hypothetical protein [Peptococcaceae bacterium]
MDKEERTKVFMLFLLYFALAVLQAFCLGVCLASGKWIMAISNAVGMACWIYVAIKSHKYFWSIAYNVGTVEGNKEAEEKYFKAKAKRRGDRYGTIDI